MLLLLLSKIYIIIIIYIKYIILSLLLLSPTTPPPQLLLLLLPPLPLLLLKHHLHHYLETPRIKFLKSLEKLKNIFITPQISKKRETSKRLLKTLFSIHKNYVTSAIRKLSSTLFINKCKN